MGVDEKRAPGPMQLVTFVIVSDRLSVDQITLAVGTPPDRSLERGAVREGSRVSIPAREASWELRETVADPAQIDEAVVRLVARLRPLKDALVALCEHDCRTKLEIVQRVSPDSTIGLVIEAEDLQLLAELGAFIDIDQYIEL
jgi:hypothetical protein